MIVIFAPTCNHSVEKATSRKAFLLADVSAGGQANERLWKVEKEEGFETKAVGASKEWRSRIGNTWSK